MDSLTHLVLGAAVGEVVLGKKIGYKAAVIGAIADTLPDLDMLVVSYVKDDLSELLIHRSYSHALLTHIVIAFPLAYLTYRLFKKRIAYKEWYLLWILGLFTHTILDSFTTYGNQMLLPFSNHLVAFNNVSVIDPLYTLPFMAMVIYFLCLKRGDPDRLKWAWRSLYISSGYLLLTFGVKGYVHHTFSRELKAQHITYNTLSTSPTIFNNALWAGMAYDDSTLTIGEYSVFQKHRNIHFIQYKRNLQLEPEFKSKALETVKWFSQGLYLLEKQDSVTLNFYIVKWGRSQFDHTLPKEAFVFYYQLKKEGNEVKLKTVRPSFKNIDFGKELGKLWDRIWDN